MKRGMMILAVILTARLGVVNYNGHRETWYNLNMNRIVERADSYYGITDVYVIREDGVKTYNGFVMCAGAKERYGEVVETSRGIGIILDTGEFAIKDPAAIDIATAW